MNDNDLLWGVLSLLILIVAVTAVAFFNTWIVMLFIGVLHHTFEWPTQTYSYVQLFPVVLIGSFVIGVIKGMVKGN